MSLSPLYFVLSRKKVAEFCRFCAFKWDLQAGKIARFLVVFDGEIFIEKRQKILPFSVKKYGEKRMKKLLSKGAKIGRILGVKLRLNLYEKDV